jgi:hypothetical protein
MQIRGDGTSEGAESAKPLCRGEDCVFKVLSIVNPRLQRATQARAADCCRATPRGQQSMNEKAGAEFLILSVNGCENRSKGRRGANTDPPDWFPAMPVPARPGAKTRQTVELKRCCTVDESSR